METWPKDNPMSLLDICLHFLVDDYITSSREEEANMTSESVVWCESLIEENELCLPSNLTEGLVRIFVAKHEPELDCINRFLSVFNKPSQRKLQRVCLKGTTLIDSSMDLLCFHPLIELDLSNCRLLTGDALPYIKGCSDTLISLKIDMPHSASLFLTVLIKTRGVGMSGESAVFPQKMTVLHLPNLRYFSGYKSLYSLDCLSPQTLGNIQHLDISGCELSEGDADLLAHCKHLVWLSVADVSLFAEHPDKLYENLAKLTTLRHLDLSQLDTVRSISYDPNLQNLVDSLPLLKSLDISGTSLAGVEPIHPDSHRLGPVNKKEKIDPDPETGIIALSGRHFDFLGLFECKDNPCSRTNLQADKVTGDANEDQIILALKVYSGHAVPVTRVLNVLFDLYRDTPLRDHYAVLDGILNAMESHPYDTGVQISGSATIFYIVKGERKQFLTPLQKKRVIKTLVAALGRHLTEFTMLRNGCLTLCYFDIPHDIMFCYQQLVEILLNIMTRDRADDFIKRLCIYLLNSVACQIDHKEKLLLGNMGLIAVMVRTIAARLREEVCDEITKCAWSTLWNVTDETSSNCEEFLDLNGMTLFLDCLSTFPNESELIRNTMGLMGNVAEVRRLRPRLMSPAYITAFSDLLSNLDDSLEISYNAAGVLAHIMADCDCSWADISEPTRQLVQSRMNDVIMSWDVKAERNINYRSFEPIIRLLKTYHSPESQLWATWALCNLSLVYPQKYCSLIEKEGGLQLLEELLADPRPNKNIKHFATMTLDTFVKHKRQDVDMIVDVT